MGGRIFRLASWPRVEGSVSRDMCTTTRTHNVFAEGGVGESHDGLERVWSTSVRYDGDIVCGGHRCNLDELCQSPQRKIQKHKYVSIVAQTAGPAEGYLSHDIRLQDID